MRIATFNLESLDRTGDDGTSLAERCEVLRPQLLRLEADILCLQEINGQRRKGEHARHLDALDALLAGTPYAGFHRAVTAGPHGDGVADVHNLVTLSRWPISDESDIRNTLLPPISYKMTTACPPLKEPVSLRFDRSILLTTIALDQGPRLNVINVHLRAPLAAPIAGQKEAPFVWKSVAGWAEGYFVSGLKRSAQALEARLVVDRLMDADPHQLIVVAGDFNARDHETALEILAGAEENTGSGRLAIRALALLDRAIPEDQRFTVLHHGRPEMLDHILVNRPMLARFRSIAAHNETLGDEMIGFGKTRHRTASYHAPLVAEFATPD